MKGFTSNIEQLTEDNTDFRRVPKTPSPLAGEGWDEGYARSA
jgi:hypothetical protein